MTTFRGINLRSGDLAEQLGFFLLQTVALVAPVPRTEDVGVDAVVTLLRNYDNKRYIASDSFFVQIKSASVRSINFNRKEDVQWLANLEIPFFVASVDKTAANIELFCSHRLSDAIMINQHRDSLTIILEIDPNPDDFVSADEKSIYIGPPVMKWSIETINSEDNFQTKFFEIVRTHVQIARENIPLRSIGFINSIAWKTNTPPEVFGWKQCCSDKDPNIGFANVDDKMAPYFSVWLDKCLKANDMNTLEDRISLMQKNLLLMKMKLM